MNGFDVVIRCGMRRGIDGKEEIIESKGIFGNCLVGRSLAKIKIPLSTAKRLCWRESSFGFCSWFLCSQLLVWVLFLFSICWCEFHSYLIISLNTIRDVC